MGKTAAARFGDGFNPRKAPSGRVLPPPRFPAAAKRQTQSFSGKGQRALLQEQLEPYAGHLDYFVFGGRGYDSAVTRTVSVSLAQFENRLLPRCSKCKTLVFRAGESSYGNLSSKVRNGKKRMKSLLTDESRYPEKQMKQYYVYILASKRNGTLYTGSTDDLLGRDTATKMV